MQSSSGGSQPPGSQDPIKNMLRQELNKLADRFTKMESEVLAGKPMPATPYWDTQMLVLLARYPELEPRYNEIIQKGGSRTDAAWLNYRSARTSQAVAPSVEKVPNEQPAASEKKKPLIPPSYRQRPSPAAPAPQPMPRDESALAAQSGKKALPSFSSMLRRSSATAPEARAPPPVPDAPQASALVEAQNMLDELRREIELQDEAAKIMLDTKNKDIQILEETVAELLKLVVPAFGTSISTSGQQPQNSGSGPNAEVPAFGSSASASRQQPQNSGLFHTPPFTSSQRREQRESTPAEDEDILIEYSDEETQISEAQKDDPEQDGGFMSGEGFYG